MTTPTPTPTPTAQEVFNTVCDHLMKQGRKSASDLSDAFLPICQYRAEDRDTGETLKCAAGVFILDDVYTPAMEGKPWHRLMADLRWGPQLAHLAPHTGLIETLQVIHDIEDVETWPSELRNVADLHGLELPASVKERLGPT